MWVYQITRLDCMLLFFKVEKGFRRNWHVYLFLKEKHWSRIIKPKHTSLRYLFLDVCKTKALFHMMDFRIKQKYTVRHYKLQNEIWQRYGSFSWKGTAQSNELIRLFENHPKVWKISGSPIWKVLNLEEISHAQGPCVYKQFLNIFYYTSLWA